MHTKESKRKKPKDQSSKRNGTNVGYQKAQFTISPSANQKVSATPAEKDAPSMGKQSEHQVDLCKSHLIPREYLPWEDFLRKLRQMIIDNSFTNSTPDIPNLPDVESEDEYEFIKYSPFPSQQVSTINSAETVNTSTYFGEQWSERVFHYLETLDRSKYQIEQYDYDELADEAESKQLHLVVSESVLMSTNEELVCKCSSEDKPQELENSLDELNEKFITRTCLANSADEMWRSDMVDRSTFIKHGVESSDCRNEQLPTSSATVCVNSTQPISFDISESNVLLKVDSKDIETDETTLNQHNQKATTESAFSYIIPREQTPMEKSILKRKNSEILGQDNHGSSRETKRLCVDAAKVPHNVCSRMERNEPQLQSASKLSKQKDDKNEIQLKAKRKSKTQQNVSKKICSSLLSGVSNLNIDVESFSAEAQPQSSKIEKSRNKYQENSTALEGTKSESVDDKNSLSESMEEDIRKILEYTIRTEGYDFSSQQIDESSTKRVPKRKKAKRRVTNLTQLIKTSINQALESRLKPRRFASLQAMKRYAPKPKITEERGVQVGSSCMSMKEVGVNTSIESPEQNIPTMEDRGVQVSNEMTTVEIGINTSLEHFNLHKETSTIQKVDPSKVKKTNKRNKQNAVKPKVKPKTKKVESTTDVKQTVKQKNTKVRETSKVQSTLSQCFKDNKDSKTSSKTKSPKHIPITAQETPCCSYNYYESASNTRRIIAVPTSEGSCSDMENKSRINNLVSFTGSYRSKPITCTPTKSITPSCSIQQTNDDVLEDRANTSSGAESINNFINKIDQLHLSDDNVSSKEIVSTSQPSVFARAKPAKEYKRLHPYPQSQKIQPPLTSSRAHKIIQPIESHESGTSLLEPIMNGPLNDPDIHIEEHLENIGKRFIVSYRNQTLPTSAEMYGQPTLLAVRDIHWGKILQKDAKENEKVENDTMCRVSWPFCSSVKSSQEPGCFSPNLSPICSK